MLKNDGGWDVKKGLGDNDGECSSHVLGLNKCKIYSSLCLIVQNKGRGINVKTVTNKWNKWQETIIAKYVCLTKLTYT